MKIRKDLTGQVFGKLVVVELSHKDKWAAAHWLCQCDCGNTKVVAGNKLSRGETKSCGCYRVQCGKDKVNDLMGQRFGRLLVIGREESDAFSHAKWLCKCDCGNETVVLGDNLIRNNHTTSCGCYLDEMRPTFNLSHGKTGSDLYNVWASMIGRCEYEPSSCWEHYGGRGITVCKEWRESFESFYEWAKDKYAADLQIDREDNDGNYCPENCRFVSRSLNVINRGKLRNNTSGYTGVSYDTHNSIWTAKIGYQAMSKKAIMLGYFQDKHTAVEARNAFIKKYNTPHKIQEVDLTL